MGFSEAVKRSSFTDWCIAVFTLALTATAIYQLVITGSQLDTMRKDQRPWIKVAFTPNPAQPLAPIGGTIHLVNNGKTPARGIVNGDFVVELVKNGTQATLDYPNPHVQFTTGIITPNDIPEDVPVDRRRSTDKVGVSESDPLLSSEYGDFNSLKIFFIVYGTVRYSDFFGTAHWTKFCAYMAPVNTPGTVTAQPCTNYGDVDSN